ncbi:MAG TPA: hypothetical protein VG672_22005 [Bryobacteraceae bacterium]|jgi:hypothetical protein|nr:hypothetical protein [Bryobacteraceae bacterium]
MRAFLLSAVFALATLVPAAPAAAVYVRVGPPRPVREVIVARPSPRHVWIPGYYAWNGGRYNWVRGYWAMPPRPRAVWVPGSWVHRRGGYVWIAGYWR